MSDLLSKLLAERDLPWQQIHWFWGDTNRPGYPLGNFHVPGATSQLPAAGGLDPGVGYHRIKKGQVVAHAGLEQLYVLGDKGHAPAQRFQL